MIGILCFGDRQRAVLRWWSKTAGGSGKIEKEEKMEWCPRLCPPPFRHFSPGKFHGALSNEFIWIILICTRRTPVCFGQKLTERRGFAIEITFSENIFISTRFRSKTDAFARRIRSQFFTSFGYMYSKLFVS